MKRFSWGLCCGVGAGLAVYLVTGHIAAAIVVALAVAVIIWFSRVGDLVVDIGDLVGDALVKGWDDII